MIYTWMIPLTLLYAVILAYNNVNGGWWSLLLLYILPLLIPAWVIISKCSKNLIFDGILYDTTLFVGYTTIIIVLMHDKFEWNIYHIIGLSAAVIGLILLKLDG